MTGAFGVTTPSDSMVTEGMVIKCVYPPYIESLGMIEHVCELGRNQVEEPQAHASILTAAMQHAGPCA